MWLLPTLSRPEKMQRLLDSMSEADKAENFCVVYWERDQRLRHYSRVNYPAHWRQAVTPCEWVRDKVNWFFNEYPNESFYSGLSDDITLDTPGMLPAWRAATSPWLLTWTADGWANDAVAAHPAMGGKLARSLARAIGGEHSPKLAHPLFPHYGIEYVMFWTARALNLARYLPHLRYNVLHPARGHAAEDDETYRKNRRVNAQSVADREAFPPEELARLVECVRADLYADNAAQPSRRAA